VIAGLRPRAGEPVAVARFSAGGDFSPAPIRWSRPAPPSPVAPAGLVAEVAALGELLAGLARTQAAAADAHAEWMRSRAEADAILADLAAKLR
jgi:IS5 family transposase